ncbi:MAG: uroporphyrinogen decarboxylase [Bacteroidota bacterium]
MNELFLRACKRQSVDRTPVWIMRQAGRYLPEYREVRARADFLTMCRTPELAAEVTVQPVDIIGVDAAIIFSDILVLPAAMGLPFEMEESRGPRFPKAIRTRRDVEALRVADPLRDLRYVLDAIELSKRILGGRVPLIGFSGAPWTLATYMVEGGGSKTYQHINRMMLDDPETFRMLIEKITLSVQLYLEAQLAAGADAVQIFDSWAGVLPPDHFMKWSLDPIEQIVSKLHRSGQPVIVFCKGANHSLRELSFVGADVIALDWTVDIAVAREETGERVALQGNLNPSFLYASPERIRHEVRSILQKYGPSPGHVFNLGHGIFPDVPVDHVRAMVRSVKEESRAFHNR